MVVTKKQTVECLKQELSSIRVDLNTWRHRKEVAEERIVELEGHEANLEANIKYFEQAKDK